MAAAVLISIIIPTLNEAGQLTSTLAALPLAPGLEIIVVDGGSADATREAAAMHPGVQVLISPRGRGIQMNTGALAAQGELLTFLHADTHLMPAHLAALRRALADPRFQAGAFKLAFTPCRPAMRFIAWGANRRCRYFGLPYGDQVLSLRRGLFFSLGGYAHRRPEDLDLVLRLRRHTRLALLEPPVATSARKWLDRGYLSTTLDNWLFLARHLAERAFTSRWPEKGDLAGKF
jgi:rSAM/selenodomain-associated transferase 2